MFHPFFMMSLIQTVGHKMAALTVIFVAVVATFKCQFLTHRTRNPVKICYVYFFFSLLLTGPVVLLSLGSTLTYVNKEKNKMYTSLE